MIIAKQRNTFAKRVREMEKKRKAEDKRARRQRRIEQPGSTHVPPENPDHDAPVDPDPDSDSGPA